MSHPNREELLKAARTRAADRLNRAGQNLALRQETDGPQRGNVPPWPGSLDADLHGTLAAIWIWSRAQALSLAAAERDNFVPHVKAGWAFVKNAWSRFIPKALGPEGSDEAAYDCAMVLRAALCEPDGLGGELEMLPQIAARLLGAHLTDLDDLGGRDFRDPGFLAWSLLEYARARDDRGLMATGRRFVDRAFGMKAPPPFDTEPASGEGLFDFSSTTSTRILAVLAAEGSTPFVGAWLRERVAAHAPRALLPRALDEHCWNGCVAAALGRAFLVATDPTLFEAHERMVRLLDERAGKAVTLGRAPGYPEETHALFYFGLALDSLVRA
jgi:hypothetical protein